MKRIAFILILLQFACKQKIVTDSLTIKEGKGIAQIVLHKSTITDVKTRFGNNYDTTKWGEHSIEYKYSELGLSFSHEQNSNDKIVSYIDIDPNAFVGNTQKDLKVNKNLTISDVVEIYGDPIWNYTLDTTELYAEYDGIEFEIVPFKDFTNQNFLNNPKQDEHHMNYYKKSKIIEISVRR